MIDGVKKQLGVLKEIAHIELGCDPKKESGVPLANTHLTFSCLFQRQKLVFFLPLQTHLLSLLTRFSFLSYTSSYNLVKMEY